MTRKINLIGLCCPEPLMIVRKEMRSLNNGDILEVKADDQSTKRDFRQLCEHMNYSLESVKDEETYILFSIKK
jgi:tRNA 2-thiouridine synthesizing protein A